MVEAICFTDLTTVGTRNENFDLYIQTLLINYAFPKSVKAIVNVILDLLFEHPHNSILSIIIYKNNCSLSCKKYLIYDIQRKSDYSLPLSNLII